MQIICKQQQWIGDIAVRETGSFESVFAFAETNNVSITDYMETGTTLNTVDAIDKRVTNYYKINSIFPATELTNQLQEGIEFWFVEYDFVVS